MWSEFKWYMPFFQSIWKGRHKILISCCFFLTLRGNPMVRLERIKIYYLLYATIFYYFHNDIDGWVLVCVRERHRDRDRETHTETERQADKLTDRWRGMDYSLRILGWLWTHNLHASASWVLRSLVPSHLVCYCCIVAREADTWSRGVTRSGAQSSEKWNSVQSHFCWALKSGRHTSPSLLCPWADFRTLSLWPTSISSQSVGEPARMVRVSIIADGTFLK